MFEACPGARLEGASHPSQRPERPLIEELGSAAGTRQPPCGEQRPVRGGGLTGRQS